MQDSAGEISRFDRANSLGLAYLRSTLLLNGGGIIALLTFLGNASAQTAISIPLMTIKIAMSFFLLAISSMMLGLLISYSYTASAPDTDYSEFWNRHIIKLNSICGAVALTCFVLAVLYLVFGSTQVAP
jgi:hypothetical protein